MEQLYVHLLVLCQWEDLCSTCRSVQKERSVMKNRRKAEMSLKRPYASVLIIRALKLVLGSHNDCHLIANTKCYHGIRKLTTAGNVHKYKHRHRLSLTNFS